MRRSPRQGICWAAVLAVIRLAAAAQQGHEVSQQLGRGLRIAASSSLAAHSGAPPAKDSKTDVQFKMPTYHHADSVSIATNGFLDWFVLIYWGSIVLFLVIAELATHLNGGVPLTHTQQTEISEETSLPRTWNAAQTQSQPPFGGVASAPSRPLLLKRNTSSLLYDAYGRRPTDSSGRSKDLAPNVWALNLVASRGAALDRKGNVLSPKLVFLAGILMGFVQLLTLFLVVYDIDPAASAYTMKPSDPWKESPLTVNCMKVIMTFFLGMYVVSEAADAYDNLIIGLGVKDEELLVHRFFVLFTPCFHYLITLSVIFCGVSVVLSCQDVPNILYNSMAILFITQVDELFWGFFQRTFSIDADWSVSIRESEVSEIQLLKKCLIMFPMFWGFGLLGRSWYRGQMPAQMFTANLKRIS